jgi:hypothetical protein
MFFFKISANLSLMARASGSVFYLTNSSHRACVIWPMCFGTNCLFTYFLFMSDFHLWNNHHILIIVVVFTNSSSTPSGYFLRYIPPKLLLCGMRLEPPILDGDGDIVSNLKSASVFEHFPCFRWFNWKDIQIKCSHVIYSGRHLIATLFPLFSL